MTIRSQLPNKNFRDNFDLIFKKEDTNEFKELATPIDANPPMDISECFDDDETTANKYGSS